MTYPQASLSPVLDRGPHLTLAQSGYLHGASGMTNPRTLSENTASIHGTTSYSSRVFLSQ